VQRLFNDEEVYWGKNKLLSEFTDKISTCIWNGGGDVFVTGHKISFAAGINNFKKKERLQLYDTFKTMFSLTDEHVALLEQYCIQTKLMSTVIHNIVDRVQQFPANQNRYDLTRIEHTFGRGVYRRTTEEVLCNDFIRRCVSEYNCNIRYAKGLTDILKTMGVYDMLHLTTNDTTRYAHHLTYFFSKNVDLQPQFFSLLRELRDEGYTEPNFNEDTMFYIQSYYTLIKFISDSIYNKIKKGKEDLDVLNESMKEKIAKKEIIVSESTNKYELGFIECQISNLQRDIDRCKEHLESLWNEPSNVYDKRPFKPIIFDIEKKNIDDIYNFVMTNVDSLISENRLSYSPTKIIEKFLEAISF
jgi:hypothetical protein